jgi:hypothetical protein
MVCRNGLITIPVALDLQAILIEPAAPVTMTQSLWIIILECLLMHVTLPDASVEIPCRKVCNPYLVCII